MRKNTKYILGGLIILIIIIILSYLMSRNFCPPWKSYITESKSIHRCFNPSPDLGKTCLQASDCISKQCIVDINSTRLKNCPMKPNAKIFCQGISGNCSDGNAFNGIFILDKNNFVVKNRQ